MQKEEEEEEVKPEEWAKILGEKVGKMKKKKKKKE